MPQRRGQLRRRPPGCHAHGRSPPHEQSCPAILSALYRRRVGRRIRRRHHRRLLSRQRREALHHRRRDQGRRRSRGRRRLEGVRDVGQDRQGPARHHPQQGRRHHRGERRALRPHRDARQRQAHPRDARHRRRVLRRPLPLLRWLSARRHGRGRYAARQYDVARPARAHRCGRPDRAVELPVPDGGVEARSRARRGRLHRVQALIDHEPVGARAGAPDPGRHPRRRVQRRHRSRQQVGPVHPRQPPHQQARVHRLHRGRPRRRSRGGRAPDPRHAGAGRQVGQHHLPGLPSGTWCSTACSWASCSTRARSAALAAASSCTRTSTTSSSRTRSRRSTR